MTSAEKRVLHQKLNFHQNLAAPTKEEEKSYEELKKIHNDKKGCKCGKFD